MKNLDRKRIIIFAKVIIGLGLVLFLIFYVEPKAIYETYQRANKMFFLIVLLLLPVNLYLQYCKWKILSKKYFRIDENRKIWNSLFYGISGGIFTPMKSGEYFARAVPYKNAKVLDVVLATIIDKFISMFFVILIGGTFFIIFLKSLIGFSIIATIGQIIIFKTLIFLLLLFLFGSNNVSKLFWEWLKSKKNFEKIIKRASFVKSMNKRTLIQLVAISFLYHLTFTTQMTILLIAFSGENNFILFFFTSNLITFAQIIIPPIALGEIGVREGAAVYFLQNLGYSGAIGFSAALSLFFINLLVPSIVGLTLLLRRE